MTKQETKPVAPYVHACRSCGNGDETLHRVKSGSLCAPCIHEGRREFYRLASKEWAKTNA